jgi:hypothetical protein
MLVERAFVCSMCIGLAISLARHRRTGLALVSAAAALVVALLPV